jgi:hypothetical protein
MTRARSEAEAALLLSSIESLARLQRPIFITDDPVSLPGFTKQLCGLPGVHVRQGGQSLAQRVKWAIQRAFEHHELVIYTEPDKKHFFQDGMARLIEQAESDRGPGVVLPARDRASFQTFPPAQRWTEQCFAELARKYLADLPDPLYGPFAMRREAVREFIQLAHDDLGWGWRIYVLARCALAGRGIRVEEGYFPCPAKQTEENGWGDRAYRLEQLAQNVNGLRAALLDSIGIT